MDMMGFLIWVGILAAGLLALFGCEPLNTCGAIICCGLFIVFILYCSGVL
jgi:hypothetical protein